MMLKRAKTIGLDAIAHARSGDKGNHANIGIVAYTPAGFEFLRRELTADKVARFFAYLGCTSIDRFELPKVGALNFVLHNALAGGASQSLRIDTQGKLLGTAVLRLRLPAPPDIDLKHMIRPSSEGSQN